MTIIGNTNNKRYEREKKPKNNQRKRRDTWQNTIHPWKIITLGYERKYEMNEEKDSRDNSFLGL